MKILFVYPKDIADNYLARRPLLGLGYVATTTANSKHEVKIIDMRVAGATIESFKKTLKSFKPDVVGFSLVALSLEQGYDLMKIVRGKTSAKIVCGGPEVTLLPRKFLKKDYVDFVIVGEGEYSFLELLDSLDNEQNWKNISGLGYRDEGIKVNLPEVIEDLDSLPFPDWDLWSLHRYRKNFSRIKFPILTSRGCPYNCTFCDSSRINKGYRLRSAENVVDEFEEVMKKYKNKNFQVMDDNFGTFRKRVFEICDEILDRKLKFVWVVGQGFSPSAGSYKLFKKMNDAGCKVVYFGVESADDEILREIRKPHTVAQARNAIISAKKAGLIVKAPFISGLPKSTYEKERKYIDFFKETGIDMPKICHLVPFPGTPMYGWVKKNAIPIIELEKMHEAVSHTRGALDTDLFKPGFETKEYPYEERVKLLSEFQVESEKYILQNKFGKFIGYFAFLFSRNRHIRRLGVKMLDAYYDQF